MSNDDELPAVARIAQLEGEAARLQRQLDSTRTELAEYKAKGAAHILVLAQNNDRLRGVLLEVGATISAALES